MTRWTVWLAVCPPADGALNFARDEALMAHARSTGEAAIRVYAWDRPVVSFGRNERVVGRFSPSRLREADLEAVRRPTGGRVLLHDRELTYAAAGSARDGETLRSSYTAIHTLLASALARLGVTTALSAAGAAPLGEGAPCFAAPTHGELVVGNRKLVASAQWRDAGAYLQHGSVLIDNDQPRLDAATERDVLLPAVPPPATLRELLGRAPSAEEFGDAIEFALTAGGATARRVDPSALMNPQFIDVRERHYRDDAWTWRR